MQDKIVVVYVCDKYYKRFLNTSINSIKRYNKNVEFVILTTEQFEVPNATVYTFVPEVNNFKFRTKDRMHDGVYYKFWLPILPYDKILYIDCDVICQRPLNSLWNIDCPFICATESHQYGKAQAQQLGLKKYALSGMMLMNLNELRKANFTSRCLNRLNNLDIIKFHDETIINLEFNDRIKFIDVKYNYCKDRIYDNPINESDAYLLHYVGKKQKEEMLLPHNFEGLDKLKKLLENKSIAIVGNSESILSKKQGEEIDSHDIVIRFNKGFPSRNNEALGYKTDLLFLACTLTNQELSYFNPKYTIKRSRLCLNQCDFSCSQYDRTTLWQEGNKLRKRVGKTSQPSTGFMAINFALTTKYKRIDLYGFDFFKSPTYYNPKDYQTLHNGDKEAEKVFEYEQCGLVHIK